MSTAVMPTQMDIGETAFQHNRRNSACRGLYMDQWQMACSTTTTTYFTMSRHRNLSGPCTSTCTPTLDNRALATPPPGVPGSRDNREDGSHHNANSRPCKEGSSNRHGSSHRKLDRSLSDSEDRMNGNSNGGRGVNSSRYKTELCRPFDESGHCKYGDKCQFAHGAHELRNLTRHPKYKTELCRTYHSIGFCPYGPRCHFIHNEDEKLINQRKNSSGNGNSPRVSPATRRQCQMILPPSPNPSYAQRPSNLCGLNSLGSSFESVSSSSSPGNLSPSHIEDPFPPIGTFSPSAVSDNCGSEAGRESSEVGTVFNFPASDAASIGSIMTPLNIQTQQMYNNMNVAALAQFSAVLNISQNQQNNQSNFQANLNACQQNRQQQQAALEHSEVLENCWSVCGESTIGPDMAADVGFTFPPTSSSPHSNSDDSMGSNGSLELIATTPNLVNSPHDLGRSMRLPIFNKFSSDSES